MELGDYATAMKAAKRVSMKYWKQCVLNYIKFLDSDEAMRLEIDCEAEKIDYLFIIGEA